MIAYFVISVTIFISIFYLPIHVVGGLCVVFMACYAFVCRSVKSAIRRALYTLPYFISVLIMQALTPRGEAYNVMGFYLDKQGINITLIYFLRFVTVLYFLGVIFKLSKYILLPQNKTGAEIVRLFVFFKILRRNFFGSIAPIRNKNISSKQKFAIVKYIIKDVYNKTFKHYPYNRFIDLYYCQKYNTHHKS